MPLSPGSRLGPYEVLQPLGAGGMGEVYLARDTRLNRNVALKIMPANVASDASRRQRFTQEARAVAALNHPNIVGVYDTGEDQDVLFIVSELVKGETLSDLLRRGLLPLRKALDIAAQIAGGIAAAHAAGITHRDLKPANIMIAAAESGQLGRVKILDFGLARQAASPAQDGSTMTAVLVTEPGMVVGTANYMSPEQARGASVDYRSDQFSFGLILYEMLTGMRAFDRPHSVEIMAAILNEEPRPIEREIPAPLRWTIDRCLAKDPAERYDSTRDLHHELRNIRDHLQSETTAGSIARPATPAKAAPKRFPWAASVISFAAGLAAAALAIALAIPQTPDPSNFRATPFAVDLPLAYGASWSPDGKAVAYTGRTRESAGQVYIRRLDSPIAEQVTTLPQGAEAISWSGDGKRVYFYTAAPPEGVWSVAIVGGEPEPVLAANGVPAPLTGPHAFAISCDGKALAALRQNPQGLWGVSISSPIGSPFREYAPAPFAAHDFYNGPNLKFAPDGKSILLMLNGEHRREEAWLLPFPPDPSHPPHLTLEKLRSPGGTPRISWMPDSRHVTATFPSVDTAHLWFADTRSDNVRALTSGPDTQSNPAVAPNGRSVMVEEVQRGFDIVSADIDTARVRSLIATERVETAPAWAARKPVMVYLTDRNGPQEIWLRREGEPDRPLVTAHDFPAGTTRVFLAPALAPEGERVIYTRITNGSAAARLWISAISGGAPVPATDGSCPGPEYPGSWSPDGRWFTYRCAREGREDLMRVKTSGQAAPVLVHKDGGRTGIPSWSPDGQWIAYADNDGAEQLISPDGQIGRNLRGLGNASVLFSADGKTIYGVRAANSATLLVAADLATGAQRIVGDLGIDNRPGSDFNPGVRFSLAPGGKSFVYGTINRKSSLWLMEGFAPRNWFSRLIIKE